MLVGLTYHGGTLLAPGRVKHPGVGMTYVGELSGKATDAPRRVSPRRFARPGSRRRCPTRILDEVWKKLALNACTLPIARPAALHVA